MPESNEVGYQQEYIDRDELKRLADEPNHFEGAPVPDAFLEQSKEQFPAAEVTESRSGYLVEESDLDDLVRRLKLQPWQKLRIEAWSDRLRQFHTGPKPESEVLSVDSEFGRNESRWLGEVPPGGQIVRPEPESFTSE